MALSVKAGAFDSGTGVATTTIEVDTGFQPKAIIFWWSGKADTTDACSAGTIAAGVGFACGTSDRRCSGWASTSGGANSATGRIQRNDACVATVTGAGSVGGLLDLNSLDADGFTLIVDDAFSASVRVHYLALGGDTITGAVTGEFDCNDATGSQSVTGVGFEPDGVLFATNLLGSSTQGTIGLFGFGAATSATEEAVVAVGGRNLVSVADTTSYALTGECIAVVDATVANPPPVMRAEFTQFTADGFDLNWLEIGFTGTRLCNYLALAGASMKVGSLLTQTDTTTPIQVTGMGFQPSAVLFASAARAASTANASTDDAMCSIGAATGPAERGAQAVWDEDDAASGLIECATAVEHDAVYINIASDDTAQGLMDLTSMDSDGFSCIMDDADPSQNFVWWMAFGEGAGGGGGGGSRRPSQRMRMGIG